MFIFKMMYLIPIQNYSKLKTTAVEAVLTYKEKTILYHSVHFIIITLDFITFASTPLYDISMSNWTHYAP